MRLIRSLAVAAALATSIGALAAQERFRSYAEAVRVDVLVMSGRTLVRGLRADDFEVRDSGALQRVEQIEVERLPLNVVLVLDTSGSVAGARLGALVAAGRALVNGRRPADRVALVTFGVRVRLSSPLTPDRDTIREALNALYGAGATPLRDAAFAGLALREADPGRTLLLLFTDGADTASWITASKVLDTARRTDAVIYPVALRENFGGTRGTAQERRLAERFLKGLAEVTGGRVMTAGGSAGLRSAFEAILAEFRDRYVLSYEPAGVQAGGWHPIEVTLKAKRGTVTARRGYFVR